MNTADQLQKLAAELLHPSDGSGLRGQRLPGLPEGRGAYLALDSGKKLHLVIELTPDRPAIVLRKTQGLGVTTEELQIGGRPLQRYIDIACGADSQRRTFLCVVSDIAQALRTSTAPVDESVRSSLDRWRSFFRVTGGGLSKEAATGLFGELWFLTRWCRKDIPDGIAHWSGPRGARHDFQWPASSVEVKTSVGNAGGPPVHPIAGLDQLDRAETGQLYLFSLHIAADELASNTLPGLVQQIQNQISTDANAQHQFHDLLANVGYSPSDDGLYGDCYRLLSERLYKVEEGFPRLTRGAFRNGLPSGVVDVCYSIDTSACSAWLVAESPSDPGAEVTK